MKGRIITWLLFPCIIMAITTTGCAKHSVNGDKALAVFSDFSFAGSGVPHDFIAKDGQLDNTKVIAHGDASLSLPKNTAVRTQYVFHYRGRLNRYDLGISELPTRLKQEGMQDVEAPRSARDMMLLYIGGPLFRITFRQGTHQGMIFTQICRDFKTDYVLVYLN